MVCEISCLLLIVLCKIIRVILTCVILGCCLVFFYEFVSNTSCVLGWETVLCFFRLLEKAYQSCGLSACSSIVILLLGKQDSLAALASIFGGSVIFVPYPSNSCIVLRLHSRFISSCTFFSLEFVLCLLHFMNFTSGMFF